MHRFFVPAEWVQGPEVRLQGPQAHQIARVLRARRGDRLVLLDNAGSEYHVEVRTVSESGVLATVIERRPAPAEPQLSITLYQGLLKGKKQDWVFQKGTEIGIAAFVPVLCDRCVALPREDRGGERWESIIREAAEQCGRGRLPRLLPPASFQEACREAPRPSFLLSELPDAPPFKEALRDALRRDTSQVSIFVGPEGGFEPAEVACSQENGLMPVSLGRRVLRGETAGLVAATIVLYESGDLG